MKSLLSILTVLLTVSLFAQQERPARDTDAQQRAMQQAMATMFGGKDCNIEDNYSFSHEFVTEIASWTKKGKEEMRMKTRNMMDSNGEVLGIEVLEMSSKDMPQSTMILQPGKNQMVSLINQAGNKMAICMSLDNPMLQQMGQDYTKDESKMSEWRKTGNTRSILGYMCDEWASDDKDSAYSFWIAQKVDLPIDRFYKAMRQQSSSPLSIGGILVDKGMMLAMETRSKKNQERMTLEVLELKSNSQSTVTTTGYNRF